MAVEYKITQCPVLRHYSSLGRSGKLVTRAGGASSHFYVNECIVWRHVSLYHVERHTRYVRQPSENML